MIIHLNESVFNKLFLFESKNSRRADRQTLQVIAQKSGWDVNDSRTIMTQSFFRDYYFGAEGLNNDWFIVLEPNFCAAAIDKGFLNEDSTGIIDELLVLIKYAHRKAKGLIETKGREAMIQYISELRGNINSWDTLYEMVGNALELERQEAMKKANQVQGEASDYIVDGPLSFKEAQEYGNYTGSYQDIGGEICYTQNGSTWNKYTNRDKYSVYVLIKPNWDEIEPEHDGDYEDEESAYDTYGMSMIFVIVDEDGNLKTCNTRWNHEGTYDSNHDVDFALDEVELSELLGRPFSEVFKPKEPLTFERRIQMALEILNDPDDDDYDESDVSDIFDSFSYNADAYKVELDGKWNFIIYDSDEGFYHYASEQWFDAVGVYYKLDEEGEYGLGNVYIEGKGYNYIKNDGTFLLNKWVEFAEYFRNKYSTIVDGGKKYIIDRFGNTFSSKEEVFADIAKSGYDIFEMVDYCFPVNGNILIVHLFDRQNIVVNGMLAYPEQWFDDISDGYVGASVGRLLVKLQGKFNFLKIDSNNVGFLLPNWVEGADVFRYNGVYYYAEIEDKGKRYCIDVNGNDITNEIYG